MEARVFDTHTFIKKLQSAGLSEAQAEIQAHALIELLGGLETEFATRHQLDDVRKELHEELVLTKTEIESRIDKLEMRLTIRLGAMMAVAVGVLATQMSVL